MQRDSDSEHSFSLPWNKKKRYSAKYLEHFPILKTIFTCARYLIVSRILRVSLGVCVCSVAQPCLTLCDPMNCSSPSSSVHGIFQARTLEWAAFPFPGDLPNPGTKPIASPELTGRVFTTVPSGKPLGYYLWQLQLKMRSLKLNLLTFR